MRNDSRQQIENKCKTKNISIELSFCLRALREISVSSFILKQFFPRALQWKQKKSFSSDCVRCGMEGLKSSSATDFQFKVRRRRSWVGILCILRLSGDEFKAKLLNCSLSSFLFAEHS